MGFRELHSLNRAHATPSVRNCFRNLVDRSRRFGAAVRRRYQERHGIRRERERRAICRSCDSRVEQIEKVIDGARHISAIERKQAGRITSGHTLRAQLKSDESLEKRSRDPTYTFRRHLREIGGAIEE